MPSKGRPKLSEYEKAKRASKRLKKAWDEAVIIANAAPDFVERAGPGVQKDSPQIKVEKAQAKFESQWALFKDLESHEQEKNPDLKTIDINDLHKVTDPVADRGKGVGFPRADEFTKIDKEIRAIEREIERINDLKPWDTVGQKRMKDRIKKAKEAEKSWKKKFGEKKSEQVKSFGRNQISDSERVVNLINKQKDLIKKVSLMENNLSDIEMRKRELRQQREVSREYRKVIKEINTELVRLNKRLADVKKEETKSSLNKDIVKCQSYLDRYKEKLEQSEDEIENLQGLISRYEKDNIPTFSSNITEMSEDELARHAGEKASRLQKLQELQVLKKREEQLMRELGLRPEDL